MMKKEAFFGMIILSPCLVTPFWRENKNKVEWEKAEVEGGSGGGG